MKFRKKILVIEDDQLLAKTIANVLALEDFDFCIANNGSSGIQKAFEYSPDLILCDIQMDPIDGYQVFNVLKESKFLDRIPFIFISGYCDIQDIRFGMDLGADDYFTKPFNNEDLIRAIKRKLSRFRGLSDQGKKEFKTLFKLSPNGIFLFDGETVFDLNPALVGWLGLNPEKSGSMKMSDFLSDDSVDSLRERIERCTSGLIDSFNEVVLLKAGISAKGAMQRYNLHISTYERFSSYSLMLGLMIPIVQAEGLQYSGGEADAKRLEDKNIAELELMKFRLKEQHLRTDAVEMENRHSGFFSKREEEILSLSMEGLPMKIIADKLSISDRTVEKHRANLMEKTKSKNMIEVIVFALRNNLIEI